MGRDKKDVLVLQDNSASIGAKYYSDMKNFLKRLIASEEMNVGENGTHFGFITFSSVEKTKKLLDVGEKTDPEDLIKWLDHFDYGK